MYVSESNLIYVRPFVSVQINNGHDLFLAQTPREVTERDFAYPSGKRATFLLLFWPEGWIPSGNVRVVLKV